MILPRPSKLYMRGNTDTLNDYIYAYLTKLVEEIERYLGSANKGATVDGSAISNISFSNRGMNILHADGTQQIIESNRVLWEGAVYMTSSQTATLSKKVSEQMSGIVLVFSAYANSEAKDYHWHAMYVPKEAVRVLSGKGFNFPLLTVTADSIFIGSKYLYLYDDRIVGHAVNDDSGTLNGITYANNHWVLRYVIGV